MSTGNKPQPTLMPSLFDRLTDPESGGTRWRQGYSLQQTTDSVRRDLEDLLNTRQPLIHVPDEYAELKNSLLNYGLPDFASLDTSTESNRNRLTTVIEEIVTRFEPRLRDVKATLAEQGELKERHVRIHIDARLRVDPAPEVAFETILELTTGQAQVKSR